MVSHDDSTPWLEYTPGKRSAPSDDLAIRVNGKTFTCAAADHEVVRFLDLLVHTRRVDRMLKISPRSFLELRCDFRRIMADRPVAGLVKCFCLRVDVEEQRLAAWLLGKCDNPEVSPILLEHGKRAPDVLRRSIVKSLEELGAHRSSQTLAARTDDLRTHRLADYAPRDFNRALKRMLDSHDEPVPVPERVFELLVPIGPEAPVPPKSRDLIRRFLEHIRWLLRSPV